MLFDENQHIFKRPNTVILNNGPKTTGHAKQKTGRPAQNLVTFSQLICAYSLTSLALCFIIATPSLRNF
ncbi:MAG: hypothetical protein NT002_09535 [candidate division Zixibacteria bacterium]|nr:hypothetical protein [candidate division Zixibacteria bacterium]